MRSMAEILKPSKFSTAEHERLSAAFRTASTPPTSPAPQPLSEQLALP
jgi:hypothetical protein